MVSALAAGLLFGLSSGLAPGPLLVLVITQALRHGAKEGIKVSAAPLVTDLPIILGSLLLTTRLATLHRALGIVSLVGGLYVLYLAYGCFRTRPVNWVETEAEPRSLRKGIIINFLNPHPYLFWLTLGAPLILRVNDENPLAPFAFLSGFYVLLVGSKAFLALIAGKSRSLLQSKAYLYVMRGLAGLLALFAISLIKNAFVFLGVLR